MKTAKMERRKPKKIERHLMMEKMKGTEPDYVTDTTVACPTYGEQVSVELCFLRGSTRDIKVKEYRMNEYKICSNCAVNN